MASTRFKDRTKQQLRLNMPLPPNYDYGQWVRHPNSEDACNRLALWGIHGGSLWLSSETSAGKSHLLRTLVHDQSSIALLNISRENKQGNSWQLAQQWMEMLQSRHRWLIDVDAGAIPLPVAHALFHLIERARDQQRPLVIAWRGPAEQLPPELSSRLLAMEKIEMAPPADDAMLLQVLRASAGSMQWEIREQVLQSMLTYLPRRLDLLVNALHLLETRSLEQKQKPGPAWVKQQLIHISDQLQQPCNNEKSGASA